jgi:hypothetical protein
VCSSDLRKEVPQRKEESFDAISFSAGLPSKAIWSNGGVLTIVP